MNQSFPCKYVLTDQWGTISSTERIIESEKEFAELSEQAILRNCLFMKITEAASLDKKRDETVAK